MCVDERNKRNLAKLERSERNGSRVSSLVLFEFCCSFFFFFFWGGAWDLSVCVRGASIQFTTAM